MGDVAASGGYYVACGADAIVSGAATLTGSIGVFFQRLSLAGTYAKLDIGSETIARGRYATLSGGSGSLTPEERGRSADYIHAAYRAFLERIAEGRGTDPEQTDLLGQGRVWLGSAALDNGLVDRIGGLHEAVELARERAGIESEPDPERVVFPEPRALSEQLSELLSADLGPVLWRALLPFEPPPVPGWLRLPPDARLAYLPPHWVDIH